MMRENILFTMKPLNKKLLYINYFLFAIQRAGVVFFVEFAALRVLCAHSNIEDSMQSFRRASRKPCERNRSLEKKAAVLLRKDSGLGNVKVVKLKDSWYSLLNYTALGTVNILRQAFQYYSCEASRQKQDAVVQPEVFKAVQVGAQGRH